MAEGTDPAPAAPDAVLRALADPHRRQILRLVRHAELPAGQIELGMGIHGEAGISREPLRTADHVADRLLDAILADLDVPRGSRVVVLLNGLGATPQEELYVLYRRVHQRLSALGVAVHRPYVGEYVTSLEMAGASLTLLVLDEQLTTLIDATARTPFFQQQA